MLSSCPVCHINVPSSDLEWHANSHFIEDDLQADIELAKQISVAPPSPTLEGKSGNDTESLSTSSVRHPSKKNFYDETSCLVASQITSTCYKVEGDLMTLLKRCLELECGNSISVITEHVEHYQSNELEDSGWGCGWRNIQMMTSHLLKHRQDARNVLFGGSGFVPDIPSLQRWLEVAWGKGFDTFGAQHFNNRIYGSKKWIGATECATLLRSFGLRAKIVDFDSLGSASITNTKHKVYGPMDKYLLRREQRDSGHIDPSPSENSSLKSQHLTHSLKNDTRKADRGKKSGGKNNSFEVLVDWIWSYFTSELKSKPETSKPVLISDKTPLYFQHDGHSRTIVGVQKRKNGQEVTYNLLVLDPSHQTAWLEKSLSQKTGWQRLVKRGVHTLRKPQYQLCYVDPGIAYGKEVEELKVIDSVLLKL